MDQVRAIMAHSLLLPLVSIKSASSSEGLFFDDAGFTFLACTCDSMTLDGSKTVSAAALLLFAFVTFLLLVLPVARLLDEVILLLGGPVSATSAFLFFRFLPTGFCTDAVGALTTPAKMSSISDAGILFLRSTTRCGSGERREERRGGRRSEGRETRGRTSRG